MRHKTRLTASVAGFALLTGIAISPAQAQESNAAVAPAAAAPADAAPADARPSAVAPTPAASGGKGALEDIVVTAQRRSERLQDVPIAVTAVTAKMLEATGVRNVGEIDQVSPGLQIKNQNGFILPVIRGVGTTVFGAGNENSVALYVDGVYLGDPSGSLLQLTSIERVEVLKGPQGTLFGRNATGGLVQIVTRDPVQKFGGEFRGGYGNYGTSNAAAYLTGGIASNLAIDFAGAVTHQADGYGKNVFTGRDISKLKLDLALRSKLLFTPSPDTTVRLAGDYERRKGNAYSSFPLRPGTIAQGGGVSQPNPRDAAFNIEPFDGIKAYGFMGQIEQKLGDVSLVSTTAYRHNDFLNRFDIDASPLPAVAIYSNQISRQFSEELQLESKKAGPFQWTVGAFYYNTATRFAPQETLFGFPVTLNPMQPLGVRNIGSQTTHSYAGYGQATLEVVHNTNLTAGIRYTSEDRYLDASQTGDFGGGFTVPLGPPVNNVKLHFAKPTWRLALDHKFDSGVLVYASYNRGFKSGGFNVGRRFDPPIKAETLDAYEVGIKSELFDRRLRINGAAFYYNYKNIQVIRFVDNQQNFYNGAGAHNYGADIDVTGKVLDGLTLTAGLSYVHARFTKFPDASYIVPLPAPPNGPGGNAIVAMDGSGNVLPNSPDFSGNLDFLYELRRGSGTFSASGGLYYSGRFFPAVDNVTRQTKYALLNATLGWTSDSGLSVRLWGKNLTNKLVLASAIESAAGVTDQYQPPRTYGATIGYKF